MKKQYALLIGLPFIYKVVDFDLLKNNNIEPILTYLEGVESIGEGKSAYYKSLTIDEIAKIIECNKVDAIVCFNDNFLIEVAQLRKKYNIQGIKYPEIKKYKVKSESYRALAPYMRVPKTIRCKSDLKFEEIIERIGEGEYFIKPENLAGAEGSCHIKNKTDYLSWVANRYDFKKSYILQEYFDCSLVHCELIVRNGTVLYIQARRYSNPIHLILSGKITASFPIIDKDIRTNIENEAINVQKRLGYLNGVMHTEFFLSDSNELTFLETNIRQVGGAINYIHLKRAGVSFETAMVLLELDKDVLIRLNEENFDIAGYIPVKPGVVTQIDVPVLKGQYSFDVRVRVGDYCSSPKSASNAAASFVGYSSSYEDLVDDYRSLEKNDIIKYS